MPLSATNFVTKGPVLHADMLQFFNLFTGVMTDQPVTHKNTLAVGGSQATTTVPMKLYGAVGQTTHLLDLYVDPTQANPGWGIAALGLMAWGPGGAAPTDTTLSRVATQNGHSSDTAGVLITPYLEVAGNVSATSYLFANGATLSGPTATPLHLMVGQGILDFTSANEHIRTPSTNAANLSVESADGLAVVSGASGMYVTSNVYYDGTAWQRWATGTVSTLIAVGSGGWSTYTAPAGANPASSALVELSYVNTSGTAGFRGALTVNFGRGGNQGAVTLSASASTNDVLLFAENGVTYLWFNNTAGSLYLQGSGGSGWCGINCGSSSINGTLTTSSDVTVGNNLYVNYNTIYLFSDHARAFNANGASISYRCASGGVHSFEFNPGGTYAPLYGSVFNVASDKRLKDHIRLLEDPLDILLDERVHAKRYTLLADDSEHVGFVADDWQDVLPEVVSRSPTQDLPMLTLSYDHLSAVTFEALKQYVIATNARIAELESRLAA